MDSHFNSKLNSIDLNLFSQSNGFLDKETSFIETNTVDRRKKGPSVLLKHNISTKHLLDYNNQTNLQKCKSAPFLVQSKTLDNVDFSNSDHLISTPNLFRLNSPNKLLTKYDNILNLVQPTPKLNLIDNDQETPKQYRSSSNRVSLTRLAPAILCKNVCYDFKNNKISSTNVLKNVNLKCPVGSIYGLLGPSGCGKTTLIKLILGKFKPISGEIKAYGYDVLAKYSGVIGSGVGYMPQELALIFDFTIEEQLTYFGRLYFMSYDKIRREIENLCKILNLPEKTSLIKELSGGQKNRVSFACALIHKPRLLILDEPTVGLDPILRERIWLLLISLAEAQTSILITTHYIEEAKRANVIGFLRKGQLLIENQPEYLLKKYETNSLEKLFFKLCIEQIKSKKSAEKYTHHIDVNFNNSVNEMIEKSIKEQSPTTSKSSSSSDLNELKLNSSDDSSVEESNEDEGNLMKVPWIDRNDRSGLSKWCIQFFAIIIKYFILTRRRPETVLAQYVLPIIAIATFCVCIGSTPTGIKLAVINEEDCGYPTDLHDQTQTDPLNSFDDFLNKFERMFKKSEEFNYPVYRRKRSVEITTMNLDFLNDEEATTTYPSKFNLMNNLNFNENKDKNSKEIESKSLNDLIHGFDSDSIDRLIVSNPHVTTGNNLETVTKNSTHSNMINSTTESERLTSSTANPLVVNGEEENHHGEPILMPVLDKDNVNEKDEKNEKVETNETNEKDEKEETNEKGETNEKDEKEETNEKGETNEKDETNHLENNHSNITNEESNEKLSNTTDETEETDENEEEGTTEAFLDEEMKSHSVNSQFEDACFSQLLIRELNSFIFTKIPYKSHAKAIEDIKRGKIWGVIRIKKGFSRALISKIFFMDYGDANISNSLVDINADVSNRALMITLEVALSRLYPEYIKDVLSKANEINKRMNLTANSTDIKYKLYNIQAGRLPIVLGSHIFKPKFTLSDYFGIREFAAPGLLIILTYSISYALTVFSLVTEISDKMFDRHQCIGLTSNQLIFSHLLNRFIFSSSGTILILLMSVYFFDISNHGSFLNALTLLLLQSYCAMTHGMLISVLCPSLFICASVSNGYLFFVFIISGVLWSSETLPPLMKQIGAFMPSTIPCESLRTIMTRGQGFESKTVVNGYIITIAWIIIHYILTVCVFNYRKRTK